MVGMSINLTQVSITGAPFNLDTQYIPLKSIGWIEFLNESAYTLQVQIGGLNITIPAWYDYPLQIQQKSGNIWLPVSAAALPVTVNPTLLAPQLTAPSQMLLSTLYLTGETPAIVTPQPLVRQTYIPNKVTTVGGTATQLQNDGNGAGASTIETTVSGDGASAVTLDNAGNLALGNNGRAGSIQVKGGGSIGGNGLLYSTQSSGFALSIQAKSSLDNGAMSTDGAGNLTIAKALLTTGSVKRIARFTGSNDTVITHNWGEKADIVIPYYNGNFGGAPTQALFVENEGINSFEVVGQSGYSWTVLAIKF
jgi:hypothetical protein